MWQKKMDFFVQNIFISGAQWSILGDRLCRVQQRAKKSHYQSTVFVCVSSNRADAVDLLLFDIVSVCLSVCYHLMAERTDMRT